MKKIIIVASFAQTQCEEGRLFPPQKQLSCSYAQVEGVAEGENLQADSLLSVSPTWG